MNDDPSPVEPRRSVLPLVLGLAALAALAIGVLHFGDAAQFVALLRGARPAWLLPAVALQAATYAFEAGVWGAVLGRTQVRPTFSSLYALSLVALFTNQMVPTGGVAGTYLVVRGLVREGAPHAAAVSAVLVDLTGYYAAFGVAVAFALVVYHQHHDLSPVVLGMAAGIAAVGVGITGGARWLAAPGRKVPAWVSRVPVLRGVAGSFLAADPTLLRAPALLLAAFALRLCNFAADGLTLWLCLRALGPAAPAPEAIAAFVVGSIARTLGVVPGGLGTFEGATVGGLVLFGVPVEAGLAATLLFRGLSFWLPMLPGLWLGRRLARKDPS